MKSKHLAVVVVLALVVVIGVLVSRDSGGKHTVPSGATTEAAKRSGSRPSPSLAGSGSGGGSGAKTPRAAGTSIVKVGYGSGPGQLGARMANESNPEGPMSVIATPDGLVVLDQVNGRIVRYGADGKPNGGFPIAPETAQDIALGPDGQIAVLDRVNDAQLLYYDKDGQLIGQTSVVGGPITEAGGTTAVFATPGGVWIEREHGETVRVLGPDGKPDETRGTMPGRPLRDGTGSVQALVVDKAAGTAQIRVYDPKANVVWNRPIRFPAPIFALVMLDSDRTGHVYLAAFLARESPDPPHDFLDQRIHVLRLQASDGADRGQLLLPPPHGSDESMRPLTVGDDGTIYQMTTSDAGVEIQSYRFP